MDNSNHIFVYVKSDSVDLKHDVIVDTNVGNFSQDILVKLHIFDINKNILVTNCLPTTDSCNGWLARLFSHILSFLGPVGEALTPPKSHCKAETYLK